MNIKIVFLIATMAFLSSLLVPTKLRAMTLDSLPIGAAIQITGQGGAIYKFIKMIPKDDNGRTIAHSNGASGSYWMLADNYCELGNTPSSCTTATRQAWNPGSGDGSEPKDWTTMASNTGSVYQNVLMPLYNDLPGTIGGVAKDAAVLTNAFPMASVTFGAVTSTPTKSTCLLTAGSVGTGTADTVNCTWTDKISLPSYTDWQDGLNNWSYYAGANSSAQAFMMTRFGVAWDGNAHGNGFNWYAWTRTPTARSYSWIWQLYGLDTSTPRSINPVNSDISNGVTPTLWLSSSINTTCGEGSYKVPYRIQSSDCIPVPEISLSSPTAVWNSGNSTLSVTGAANYKENGQAIVIWAAACNTSGQCKQKTTTITSSSSGQTYSLIWNQNELPAGDYSGTIWVGSHVVASPHDEDNTFNQSNSANFTISPRRMDLTVVKNRAFNLVLGDAGIFNLPTGTSQGVTVSVDSATNVLSVSGTLAADKSIPFGSVVLNFKTLNVPQTTVIDSSLN